MIGVLIVVVLAACAPLALPPSAKSAGGLEPPATFYGPIFAGGAFNPTVGMTVQAYIGGSLCGQTQTAISGTQVAYSVQVAASSPLSTTCGVLGSSVMFYVAGQVMIPIGVWDNNSVNYPPLNPHRLGLSLG